MSVKIIDPNAHAAFNKGFNAGQAEAQRALKPFLEGVADLAVAVRELTKANRDVLKKLAGDEGEEWKEGGAAE